MNQPGGPDLHKGDNGKWVSYLQQMLNYHYQQSVVQESGDFDETTANAVQHFRQQNGLADGSNVDSQVWTKLLGASDGGFDHGDQHGTEPGGHGGHSGGDPAQSQGPHFQPADFHVDLMSQPEETTCWAASMVMVLNARGESYTVDSLCAKAGVDKGNQGKTWREALTIGTSAGMHEVYCACWQEEGWADVLNQNGPLWTPIVASAHHIIVVAGVRKSGNTAEIHVFDPLPAGRGQENWMDFHSFTRQYEMAGQTGANLLAK